MKRLHSRIRQFAIWWLTGLIFIIGVCTLTVQSQREECDMKDEGSICGQDNSKYGKFSKSDEELKKILTPEQYCFTQENSTERPFQNAYWDNHREGIYVDIVSGEPLFSSKQKFDSGTGRVEILAHSIEVRFFSTRRNRRKLHGHLKSDFRAQKCSKEKLSQRSLMQQGFTLPRNITSAILRDKERSIVGNDYGLTKVKAGSKVLANSESCSFLRGLK